MRILFDYTHVFHSIVNSIKCAYHGYRYVTAFDSPSFGDIFLQLETLCPASTTY